MSVVGGGTDVIMLGPKRGKITRNGHFGAAFPLALLSQFPFVRQCDLDCQVSVSNRPRGQNRLGCETQTSAWYRLSAGAVTIPPASLRGQHHRPAPGRAHGNAVGRDSKTVTRNRDLHIRAGRMIG
jgi:hypothetical protein